MAQKKIGAKIVIDGEQEFRQALLQSKNAMKEFDSEMKLVTAQFKNNEKSMEALKSKQAVYQKQQQELTKQSKLLVEQIQKASVEYTKAASAQEKQAEKIKQLEKALEKAKKEYGESAEEVQQLEQELSVANAEYDKQQRAIDQLSNKITKWNTDLNKTQTELVETDRALEETNDSIDHFDENMEDAEQETKKFGIVMGESAKHTEALRVSLGSLVSAQVVVDVLRNCARAIKDVASAAIDVGMKFDASMSNVQALSGATGETLEALGNKAREMGSKTIYSASESADAFSYMALAGWDAKQMLEGIEPVLNLAAAANMDLAQASDIVTDYITAFGLKAEDAGHFADAMATAMSTSNTTVELLGESYKNCAATCGAMGIAMEDATAVLATMANAGVKGGEAGTALNSILTRLATNTKNCADNLANYGIEVYDPVSHNMNSLSSILNGLGNVWGKLSDKEQAALAKSIAGVSHYSKFQTIMLGVSDAAKEGGQSFEDYANALRDCDGAAEQMAKTMQDNLTGDVTILKSALEGLGIATEGVFDDAFREAVQGATDAVSRLEKSVSDGDLGVSLAAMGDALAEMTGNLVDAAEKGLPGFIDGLTFMIKNLSTIGTILETVVASMVAYKAAVIADTIATEGFTVALNANPIGLIAAAVTACTVGLYELVDVSINATDEFAEMAKEAVSGYNRISDSVKDNAKSNRDYVSTLETENGYISSLVTELTNLNNQESLSEGEKRRLTDIVRELNTKYTDLNLQIDTETGKLADNTGKWKENIETQMRIAQVAAIQDKMTEAYSAQYDAQMNVYDIEQKIKKIEEEHGDELAELTKLYDENTEANQANIDRKYELEQALGGVVAEYNELGDSLVTAQEALDEENASIDQINQYLNEHQMKLDDAAAATGEYGGALQEVSWITEDLQKEFDDLQKSISNSVQSSLDLTKAWSADWSTSTEQMTKNVQSQIDGVQKWADNFDALANSSKVAIDDRVMKYLADMGTEGAGLVQQLTNELENAPEKLQGWSDAMAEYLTLQDSVATEITDSYISVMEQSITGAADTVRENASVVQEAATEAIVEGFEGAGEKGTEALASGLERGSEKVSAAAQKVGDSTLKGITDKTGTNGEKVGEVGKKADEALATGLNGGKAKEAALAVSQDVYNAVAQNLSADAGEEIGSKFMNALADAIEERGEKVIEIAKNIAEEARNIIDGATGGGDDNGEGGNQPPGHASGLAYVPYDNYLARLHEGERILTKAENREYSALLGAVKMPSFDAVQARSDGTEARAVVINNDIKVDGAQDPEAWTQTFIRTLKREARMA